MSGHGTFACVVGQKPPAMSVSWERPKVPGDSGYIVFFADLLPDEPGFGDLPAEPVCLHCLLEDGDEQLGRGLDMAKRFGQADFDVELGKWFVPDDVVSASA